MRKNIKQMCKIYDKRGKKGQLVGIVFNGKIYGRQENETADAFYDRVLSIVGGKEVFEEAYYEQPTKRTPKLIKNKKSTIELEEDFTNKKIKNITTVKSDRRIIASSIAALAVLGLVAGLTGCEKQNNNDLPDEEQTSLFHDVDLLTELEAQRLSYEELLKYLRSNIQLITTINFDEFQNEFNNYFAPSIRKEEDKDKQLYLTTEEVMALHAYLNAYNLTDEEFIQIYGGSKLFNQEKFKEDYRENVIPVMLNYALRAKEIPTDYKLCDSKAGQELIQKFWDLVVAYNKAEGKDIETRKDEMLDFFKEIYEKDKTDIDSATKTSPQEVSYILTLGIPYMEITGILTDDVVVESFSDEAKNMSFKDLLQELNGTLYFVTVNDRIKDIEAAITNNDLLSENYIVENEDGSFRFEERRSEAGIAFEQIPRALNERNIKSLDRNIEYSYERKINTSGYVDKTQSSTTTTTTPSTTAPQQVSRQEAVEQVGEEKVVQAEQAAKQEVENANRQEQARVQGVQDGYNLTYTASRDRAFANDTLLTVDSYSSQIKALVEANRGLYADCLSSYEQGVKEGAQKGIEYGTKDGKDAKALADSMYPEQKEETPSNPFVPDTSKGEEYDREDQASQQEVQSPAQDESSSNPFVPDTSNGEEYDQQNETSSQDLPASESVLPQSQPSTPQYSEDNPFIPNLENGEEYDPDPVDLAAPVRVR